MRPWHNLRAHAKWQHPCYERVEESDVQDFEEEVDGEGLGPGEVLIMWLIRHVGLIEQI